jgi:hypothetical protein
VPLRHDVCFPPFAINFPPLAVCFQFSPLAIKSTPPPSPQNGCQMPGSCAVAKGGKLKGRWVLVALRPAPIPPLFPPVLWVSPSCALRSLWCPFWSPRVSSSAPSAPWSLGPAAAQQLFSAARDRYPLRKANLGKRVRRKERKEKGNTRTLTTFDEGSARAQTSMTRDSGTGRGVER